jgi:hypothetical protein
MLLATQSAEASIRLVEQARGSACHPISRHSIAPAGIRGVQEGYSYRPGHVTWTAQLGPVLNTDSPDALRDAIKRAYERPDFDSRSYGYAKLSALITATTLFEMDRRSPGDGKQAIIYAGQAARTGQEDHQGGRLAG